jgi:hypothetical protein
VTTPREYGDLIASATTAISGNGKEASRLSEAFTRFFHKGGRTGWDSLTREDFDALEEACDDAFGRPHKRRRYLFGFRSHRWWHWHIVDPIIYPVIEAPFTIARKIWWHVWKKRHGGTVFTGVEGDDGEVYLHIITWREARDRRGAELGNLPWRYRLAVHFGWLRSGWIWECPACDISAGPDETLSTGFAARAALAEHVAEQHAGIMPEESDTTEIYWLGRR